MQDLANFRNSKAAEIDPKSLSKWVIVGGSYAGMVSALTRKNYTNLFSASWSSSGVVHAIKDFSDFDLMGAIAAGPQCAQILRSARIQIDRMVSAGGETYAKLTELFGVPGMREGDFYYFLGDLFTFGLQYGKLKGLCDPMLDAHFSGSDLISALVDYENTFGRPKICGGNCTAIYDTDALKVDVGQNGARVWTFLTCTQFGWWQVGADRLSIRPRGLTADYFQAQCHEIFDDIPDLDVEIFNKKWGGLNQTTPHTFFVTSAQDPWTLACMTENYLTVNSSVAHTVVGPEMGHCSDLHTVGTDDAPDRIRTFNNIKK